MTKDEAFATAVRWVTAAHEGKGTSVDRMFAEVARVRDRLLGMAEGDDGEPPRDRYGLTADEVAAAVKALGPLPDPPVHPGGAPGLTADERRALTVTEDRIVCLECGREVQVLKQHLQHAHGDMPPSVYLARWGLADDYPFAPAAYIAHRRAKATGQGLGRTVGYGAREGNRVVRTEKVVNAMTRLSLGSAEPATGKRPRGRPRKNPLVGG